MLDLTDGISGGRRGSGGELPFALQLLQKQQWGLQELSHTGNGFLE
jgi:hypothetical protein